MSAPVSADWIFYLKTTEKMIELQNFIANEFVCTKNNSADNVIERYYDGHCIIHTSLFHSINPATGQVFAHLPNSTSDDVQVGFDLLSGDLKISPGRCHRCQDYDDN